MGAAIPAASYVADLEADATLGVVYPLPVPAVALSGQKITPNGWLQCDPIFFPATLPNSSVNNAVIYRISDQLLIFNISFPAFATDQGKAMVLLQGYSHPGLARL